MDREELQVWSLSFGELDFVQGYRRVMRAGLALQLVHFRRCGYFPGALEEIPDDRIQYVEEQLGTHVHLYDLKSDAARRHRLDILRHLGFRRANERDRAKLHSALMQEISRTGPTIDPLIDFGFRWALQKAIFVPSRKIMERLVRSALHAFQEDFLAEVSGKLSKQTKATLDECLAEPRGVYGFLRLKDDVGAATLDSVLEAADRLAFIQGLDLPFGITDDVDPSWLRHFTRRVEGGTAYEMRRHAQEKRIGLLALYVMSRKSQLIDGLVDLLIDVIHRIGTKSRRKVIGRIAADIEKVHGKERLLVDIATAAMMTPNGRVSDVTFPVAGAAKLKAIIDEHRAKGTLDARIQMVMRGSWASHYRRMLPSLLQC